MPSATPAQDIQVFICNRLDFFVLFFDPCPQKPSGLLGTDLTKGLHIQILQVLYIIYIRFLKCALYA